MPTVDLEAARIHYRFDGDDSASTLVLVNSLGTDHSMWDKVAPAFARRYRVLRYDMRGHGLSGVPPGPYTLAELAGDLIRLLDHLKIARAHLCGLSLGGMVGAWIAIHRPERVGRLILANTDARIGSPEMWNERIAGIRRAGMAPLADATMARWFTPQFRAEHPAEIEPLRALLENCPAEGYIGCCAALRDADLRAGLSSISSRCLILAGEFDPATPAANARILHSAIRNSSFVELPCSHLSAWERPEEFQQAALDFLREQEVS